MSCAFTIFTPTHNRAHTLHRVYESLAAQTFRDFEWLVVDDGSVDNTKTLVEHWQQEAQFPIRYHYQKHSGKHMAFYWAVGMATGQFFLPMDADDRCVPEALERFYALWSSIPDNQKHQFSGVTVLCNDQHGSLVGDRFPRSPYDVSWYEAVYISKMRGEKWGFTRTNIMQEYLPPITERPTYVPESTIWSRIGRKYRTRFVNEVLRTYYRFEHDDAISASGKGSLVRQQMRAPGVKIRYRQMLTQELDYFWHAPIQFLRASANFSRFSFHTGTRLMHQARELPGVGAKAVWIAGLPFGAILYWRERLQMPKG